MLQRLGKTIVAAGCWCRQRLAKNIIADIMSTNYFAAGWSGKTILHRDVGGRRGRS